MHRVLRFAALAALLLVPPAAADEPKEKDKTAELKAAVEKADLIIVGKVSETGLGTASSFDIGVIQVSKVLRGDEKVKSVRFAFADSGNGNRAPYGKVDVEGVWLLGEETKAKFRTVLSFRPLTEEDAVKSLVKEAKKGSEEKEKKDR